MKQIKEISKLKIISKLKKILALVDGAHFSYVIDNLVSNAIKYIHNNGIVEITVTQEPDNILIDVSDTGIGIPDSDKDKIATTFYRGSKALQDGFDGTGLGLYIARSYLEQWGGKLSFESTLGKGSIFHVILPIVKP